MALLWITPETAPAQRLIRTHDEAEIAATLAPLGARFENWPLGRVSREASDEAFISAYSAEIAAFNADGRNRRAEAITVRPDDGNPEWLAEVKHDRQTYFNEHTHSEDEIWFFADGCSGFYIRANGLVHMLICTAGNLLSLPAGMRHWFDAGARPDFRALRLYLTTAGFDGHFTGDPIADSFPHLEELADETTLVG